MDFQILLSHLDTVVKDLYTIKEGKDVIFVKAEDWNEISVVLKNDSKLSFDYLMCISSYD